VPTTDRGSKLALGVFASALAVLVLNDWVFKGQGILPGWLTGKLSDFAGLIVAPVSLASFLAARQRSTQLCCIAAVATVFALTEVSPACAQTFEQLLAGVGLAWRLWPDPGDLWALAVLPIGWFCCRALSGHAGARSSAGRVARWLTLPACLACLASGGPGTFAAQGYVYNATEATAFVEVSSAWLDCEALSAFDHPFLDGGDFVSQGSFELAAGTVLPLDFMPDPSSSVERGDCMCALHRVSAAGRTVNVALQDLPSVYFLKKPRLSELVQHRGQLVTLRAEPEPIEVGARLGTFQLAPSGAGSSGASCPSPEPPGLDVSFPLARDFEQTGPSYETPVDDAPIFDVYMPILALTPIAGNCFELTLGASGATVAPMAADAGTDAGESLPPARFDTVRIQICAPLELFPFRSGDYVRSQQTLANPTEPTRETLDIRNGATHFRLVRGRYYEGRYSDWQNYQASLPAVRCGPLRDTDGALFEPIDVAYAGQALVPGQAVRIADPYHPNHQMYLGRARRQLGRACGTDRSWIEVVETWTN
jgi:hypothetical protein